MKLAENYEEKKVRTNYRMDYLAYSLAQSKQSLTCERVLRLGYDTTLRTSSPFKDA